MRLNHGGVSPVAVAVSTKLVGAWASWPDDILFVSEQGGFPKSQLDRKKDKIEMAQQYLINRILSIASTKPVF